jgi:hypothetical protein
MSAEFPKPFTYRLTQLFAFVAAIGFALGAFVAVERARTANDKEAVRAAFCDGRIGVQDARRILGDEVDLLLQKKCQPKGGGNTSSKDRVPRCLQKKQEDLWQLRCPVPKPTSGIDS